LFLSESKIALRKKYRLFRKIKNWIMWD
jgi:hypothetical protein